MKRFGNHNLWVWLTGACILTACIAACTTSAPPESANVSARVSPNAPVPANLPLAAVGQRIFSDVTLSEPRGTSCASCHDAQRAFVGDNGAGNDPGFGVARGSKPDSLGTRNAPTLLYAQFVPPFGWIEKDGKRVPRGGLLWSGAAPTLAAQARGPLFHPLEMNNPSVAALAEKLARSPYADALKNHAHSASSEHLVDAATRALEAFQRTPTFAPFSSKFDAVQRGAAKFSEQEQRGLSLFQIRQKGNCATCHTVNETSKNPQESLFTNFEYHALGAPRNRALPHNKDATFFDLGLCEPTHPDATARAPKYCGQFRTPTLRNIALTAPYMHNGVFVTLREAVAFYATRDTDPKAWYPSDKFDDLPLHLRGNVDLDTPPYQRGPRNPGERARSAQLNDEEIDDIVVFLQTLTDGYRTK